MTVLAASGPTILIPILFALACPLMMILMMRGHGHGSGGGQTGGCRGGHGDATEPRETSVDELRSRRAELDRHIAEREAEQETPTPAGG